MVRKTDKPPNATGRNQHRSGRIIDDIPDIVERIQKYLNDGLRLKEIPDALASDLPGATISVRSIKRFIQKNNIQTTRKSGLTDLEKGMAILKIKEDDPLGRWGARRVKEKLAHEQIHIPRDFITRFLSEEDPLGAERRNPHIKKKHKYGLT